jgi:hypothetical protein
MINQRNHVNKRCSVNKQWLAAWCTVWPQGVLLSLLSHLAMGLDQDTARRVAWVHEAANALDVSQPATRPHFKCVVPQAAVLCVVY